MPTFYDKFFKPTNSKRIKTKINELPNSNQINVFQEPIPIRDIEAQMIDEWFKTKKKSLANQKVDEKSPKK
jgi:hypothetical protein